MILTAPISEGRLMNLWGLLRDDKEKVSKKTIRFGHAC